MTDFNTTFVARLELIASQINLTNPQIVDLDQIKLIDKETATKKVYCSPKYVICSNNKELMIQILTVLPHHFYQKALECFELLCKWRETHVTYSIDVSTKVITETPINNVFCTDQKDLDLQVEVESMLTTTKVYLDNGIMLPGITFDNQDDDVKTYHISSSNKDNVNIVKKILSKLGLYPDCQVYVKRFAAIELEPIRYDLDSHTYLKAEINKNKKKIGFLEIYSNDPRFRSLKETFVQAYKNNNVNPFFLERFHYFVDKDSINEKINQYGYLILAKSLCKYQDNYLVFDTFRNIDTDKIRTYANGLKANINEEYKVCFLNGSLFEKFLLSRTNGKWLCLSTCNVIVYTTAKGRPMNLRDDEYRICCYTDKEEEFNRLIGHLISLNLKDSKETKQKRAQFGMQEVTDSSKTEENIKILKQLDEKRKLDDKKNLEEQIKLQEQLELEIREKRKLEEQLELQQHQQLQDQLRLQQLLHIQEQSKLQEQKRIDEKRKLEEQLRLQEQKRTDEKRKLEEQLRLREQGKSTNNITYGFTNSGTLNQDQQIFSKNNLFRAIMQADGNFVIYKSQTPV
ncbi:MAG: hypothetical protein ACYCST_21840, partial [Acidimicrobiales bacterium]